MISKFFIERPVLSNVIAILMILIGGVCLFRLAVAQYPDVVPPTVQVTTRYPGASAKTVIDTVAQPIEQQPPALARDPVRVAKIQDRVLAAPELHALVLRRQEPAAAFAFSVEFSYSPPLVRCQLDPRDISH